VKKLEEKYLINLIISRPAYLPESFALSSEHTELCLKNKTSMTAAVLSLLFVKRLAAKRSAIFAPRLLKLY
jgi:hypothetical protein